MHKLLSPELVSLFFHASEELAALQPQLAKHQATLQEAADQKAQALAVTRQTEDADRRAKWAQEVANLAVRQRQEEEDAAARRAAENDEVDELRRQAAAETVMSIRIFGTLAALEVVQNLEPTGPDVMPADAALTHALALMHQLWKRLGTHGADDPIFATVLRQLQEIRVD